MLSLILLSFLLALVSCDTDRKPRPGGVNVAAIVGGAVGGSVCLICSLVLTISIIVCLCRRRRKRVRADLEGVEIESVDVISPAGPIDIQTSPGTQSVDIDSKMTIVDSPTLSQDSSYCESSSEDPVLYQSTDGGSFDTDAKGFSGELPEYYVIV